VADQREAILSRLAALCGAVSGINAVGRNRLDVGDMLRPAVVVLDGSESFRDAPDGTRIDVIQRMDLSPEIMIFVRGGNGTEAGSLMALYRTRIVAAILSDSELAGIVTTNGGIRYQGCAVAMPDAEAQEHRIDISMTFSYVFKLSELV
jgi:hypothetical protein